MKLILYFVAAILILLIQFWRQDKKRRQELRDRLVAAWGMIPKNQLEEADLKRIARYYERSLGQDPKTNHLDDITWNDLGMDQIFARCNHTQSSLGEEALYCMLRMPETDPHILTRRDRLAEYFSKEESLRLELEICLHSMGKSQNQAVSDYISQLAGQPAGSYGKHYLGLAALAASLLAMLLHPGIGFMLLAASVGYQIISYYREKAQIEPYLICIANVVRISQCAKDLLHVLEHYPEHSLREYEEKLKQWQTQLLPLCKKAKMLASGKAMGGSPWDLVTDYLKILIHSDLIAYHQIVAAMSYAETAIWETMDVLGQLECGLAMASLRQSLSVWCKPELQSWEQGDLYLEAVDLYHPLLQTPVTNSIQAHRSQLITGSNASGKSTFLRTVAVSAVLAQTMYTVPGRSYRAPYYHILSSMALQDDLLSGESYYMAEIRSIKRIMDQGQGDLPVLCVVDEVLRGTNTVERIAASTQILRRLSQLHVLCFAATHDGELTHLLEADYDNGHFSESMDQGDIYFDYRLRPGRARGRNALQLLSLMGYEESVLQQARDMAERFDRTGRWSMYDEG